MDDLRQPPVLSTAFLESFEEGLDPLHPEKSRIPARVLGFGEISSILAIRGVEGVAFKRLPIFSNRSEAEVYARMFHSYSRHLEEAGLTLPGQATAVVPSSGGAALYIAQRELPLHRFGHRLIHQEGPARFEGLIRAIAARIDCVWGFNAARRPELELALDGQLSNWVRLPREVSGEVLYIDTSTPLFRLAGREQLDPEKLLKSAPAPLRWILRLFFLDDVMNRYYIHREVVIDMLANLYKEQRPDLIAPAVAVVNRCSAALDRPITTAMVARYYRTDRIIWTLFLAFRRADRWLACNLFRRRYEFILPGTINR